MADEKKDDKETVEFTKDQVKEIREMYKKYSVAQQIIETFQKSKLSISNKYKMLKDKKEGDKSLDDIKEEKDFKERTVEWKEIIGKPIVFTFNKNNLIARIGGKTRKTDLWIMVRMHDGHRIFSKYVTPSAINTFDYKSGTYLIMKDRIVMEGNIPVLNYIIGFPCPMVFSTEGVGYSPEDNIVNNRVRTSQELHSAVYNNALRRVTEDVRKQDLQLYCLYAIVFMSGVGAYFSYLNHNILLLEIRGLVSEIGVLKVLLEALPSQIQSKIVAIIRAIPK